MTGQARGRSPNSILLLVQRDLTRWRRPLVGALVLATASSVIWPTAALGWSAVWVGPFVLAHLAALLVGAFILAAAIQADPLRSPERRLHGRGLSTGAVLTGKVLLAAILIIPLILVIELPWLVGFGIPWGEGFLALGSALLAAWTWSLIFVVTAAYLTHSLKVFAAVFFVLLVVGGSIQSLVSDHAGGVVSPPTQAYGAALDPGRVEARDPEPEAAPPSATSIAHARVHGRPGRPEPSMLFVALGVDPTPGVIPGLLVEPEVTVQPRRDGPEGSGRLQGSHLLTQIPSPVAPPRPSDEWISDRPIRWLQSGTDPGEADRWIGSGFSVEIPEATGRGFRDSGGRVTLSSRLVTLEPFVLVRLSPETPRLTDHRIRWRIDGWGADDDGPRIGVGYLSSRLGEGLPHLVLMNRLGMGDATTGTFQYILHHRDRGEALVLESTDRHMTSWRSAALFGAGGERKVARKTLIPSRPLPARAAAPAATDADPDHSNPDVSGPNGQDEWTAWLEGVELVVVTWAAAGSRRIELEWEDEGSGIHIGDPPGQATSSARPIQPHP